MADESEKKPEFVLNKKEKTTESQPKKKVVVIKRKTTGAAGTASTSPKEPRKEPHRVVVAKKAPESSAKPEDTKSAVVPESKPASRPASAESEKPAQPQTTSAESKPAQKSQVQTFELHSARPNVKAGNLSGGPRGRYGNGGYNRRDGGGFTGTQAREGYQSRERTGGYNNGGQRTGGFNNGSRQGGYNNGGQRTGGFNNGPRQGGFGGGRPGFGGGAGRPGQGAPRPGFGGGAGRPFSDPSAIAGNKVPAKKQFKGKKQVYNRKNKEDVFDENELYQNKKREATPASVVPSKIDIMETISVSDLAKKMNLKASEIIAKLLSMGTMVTINQYIDSDTATILASEYNCQVHLVSLYDETVIESDQGSEESIRLRPPIVTVMGHVDHGKTKTLDAIRNTNVVDGEAGGITQKIGAYQVATPKGVITFLDTPGHEAFTMMRARGAQITDIVVLVVAADDGVMPQTLEAINHAKDAKVPIIVAVNKIDKPEANPDRVMTQLSERGLTPEAWGGDTQYVNISALKREGIDDLLDAILVQAEMLELKAQYDCRAEGKVIESRIDQGRGVVTSVIIQRGTLHTGDPFVAGIYSGRVRAIFNDRGQKIHEATPSMPVEILGIESMPNAGDPFRLLKQKRMPAHLLQKDKNSEDLKKQKPSRRLLSTIFIPQLNRKKSRNSRLLSRPIFRVVPKLSRLHLKSFLPAI